jgi:hypothetical protein
MGHPQVKYKIRYLKDYFLIQRIRCTYAIDIGMLFVVIDTSTCNPNTCYQTEYENKNCKISKIPRY